MPRGIRPSSLSARQLSQGPHGVGLCAGERAVDISALSRAARARLVNAPDQLRRSETDEESSRDRSAASSENQVQLASNVESRGVERRDVRDEPVDDRAAADDQYRCDAHLEYSGDEHPER